MSFNLFVYLIFGVRIFRQVGGAKEECGGVAALRRTSDDEVNAEMAEKPRSNQRIISK
jgi:hypothetical protein